MSFTSVKEIADFAYPCTQDRRHCAPRRHDRRRNLRRWRSGRSPTKAIEYFRILRRDPAGELKLGRAPIHLYAIFIAKPGLQHVELQRADNADQSRGAIDRPKHLGDTLLGQLLKRQLELFCPHGIGQPNAAENLRREVRHADKVEVFTFRQRVADPQCAVVGNADHVAGVSFLGERAILGEEELRRMETDGFFPFAPA